jgi:large subunit ribosomal protein L21
MYAIIDNGGKQLKVEVGQEIYVEKLDAEPGDEIVFDKVLACGDKELQVGTPYLKNAKVTATVDKHGKQKKVMKFMYTQKNRSTRVKQGHRQPYTKVKITAIEG